MSNTTPVSRTPTGAPGPADLPVRAAHGEPYTRPEAPCRGVPWARRRSCSGHSGRPELDAHAGAHRLGRLGDAVLPRALAGAAHDHEITVAQWEPEALAATFRPEHQRSRRPEGDDRDHRVRRPAAPDAVAVPGD